MRQVKAVLRTKCGCHRFVEVNEGAMKFRVPFSVFHPIFAPQSMPVTPVTQERTFSRLGETFRDIEGNEHVIFEEE